MQDSNQGSDAAGIIKLNVQQYQQYGPTAGCSLGTNLARPDPVLSSPLLSSPRQSEALSLVQIHPDTGL